MNDTRTIVVTPTPQLRLCRAQAELLHDYTQ